VAPSVTEATTRNLPNPPQMPDMRQTNNFTSPPYGSGQQPPPGNFQPNMVQQRPYVAVPLPPRRSNGPKILLISFIAFAFMAFCMVAVIVGLSPFRNKHNKPTPIATPSVPVSGTSYVKTFKLPSDGQISLQSMSGGISVNTYDGDTVEFKALRSDGSNIPMDDAIDMNLAPDGKTFSAKYRGGRNANLSYELKIPRKLGALSLSSVSGDIKIAGVDGNIKVKSTSGRVTLDGVTGGLDIDTTSGDQSITFKTLPTADLKLHSISGDVSATFPGVPDLKVSAHTISGDIRSDFPLEQSSKPASNRASGVLGKGLFNFDINTISGDIRIGK
jgi:hypothetical protein